MRFHRFAWIGIALLTGACQSDPPRSSDGSDACGAGALQTYVGQSLPIVENALGASARVIRPGDLVTTDYLPTRLNVAVSDGDLIQRVYCG